MCVTRCCVVFEPPATEWTTNSEIFSSQLLDAISAKVLDNLQPVGGGNAATSLLGIVTLVCCVRHWLAKRRRGNVQGSNLGANRASMDAEDFRRLHEVSLGQFQNVIQQDRIGSRQPFLV